MKEVDVKIKLERQIEFTRQHTLTVEDRRRLIQDKLVRARQYSEAMKKREALFVESR